MKGSLFLILLSLFFFNGNSADAAPSEEELYQDAREAYYSLQKDGKKRKYRHNWLKVIGRYESVIKKHAGGKHEDQALYMVAKLYSELSPYSESSEDIDSSTKYLDKLITSHPESSLADDALFMLGENYEKKGRKREAYKAYRRIVDDYKGGDRLADARKKASSLKRFAGSRLTQKSSPKAKKRKEPKKEPLRKKTTDKVAGSGRLTGVVKVRHWSNPNYTKIVIDLDNPAKYEYHLLRKDPALGTPPRLYIDIFNARRQDSLKEKIPINDGLLKRARAAQYDPETVRVVLDIESIKDYKIYPLLGPYRIVIDVWGDEVIKTPHLESLLQGNKKDRRGLKGALDKDALSLSKQLGLGVRKIVIDAGHGGKDPGAVGPRGTKEKHITLGLAKRVKAILEKEFNYQVVLTRKRDRYLQLDERTAIANMENADLFISIHINANKNRRAYGMETYIMNARASDRFAAEVAARENAVTQNRMGEFGSILESILVDMQKTNKINESSKLASNLQRTMYKYMSKRYKGVKNLGIKKAPFYVLIGASMPSVLVEAGFISNKREEKRLRSSRYLDSLSRGIALGVDKYAKTIKRPSSI